MSSVRSLLNRVKRLEAARSMASPFQRWFGSLDAFEAEVQAGIEAGHLDAGDMPVVMDAIRGWHRDGVFGMWQRDRVWEYGR
jgi:hypothetical protein